MLPNYYSFKFRMDKSELFLSMLSFLQKIFTKYSINMVFIKTLDYYPNFNESNDIDIIVAYKDFEKACRVLLRSGAKEVKLSLPDKLSKKFICKFDFFPYGIELYRNLSRVCREFDWTEEILSRKRILSINSECFYIPSPEDRLLITCIHSVYRHGIVKTGEISNIINLMKLKLEFSYLLEKSKSLGILDALVYILSLAEEASKELNTFLKFQCYIPLTKMVYFFFKKCILDLIKFNIKNAIVWTPLAFLILILRRYRYLY